MIWGQLYVLFTPLLFSRANPFLPTEEYVMSYLIVGKKSLAVENKEQLLWIVVLY